MGSKTTRIEIYQVDRIFERALLRLKTTPDVSDEDKTLIGQLVDHLLAKNVSKQRAVKYINHLVVVARIAGQPLGRLDKKSMETVISRINTASYTDHTKHDYKVIVKKYFQWIRGCDEDLHEYPEEVRWIKTAFKKKRLLPEELLTGEELKKLAEAAENPRDRTLILAHYESGCRIGETLSLRIMHVTFDKYGAVLMVDGKTGPRRVRIIAAAPALASWLSIHPLRNDSNAPLWVGIGTVGRYHALLYNGARAMLRRLVKKAGLKKRIYTHLLRHSRATELANILTEAQMKEHFGWVPGSDMPSTYVHLSGRDVDGALLKAHGITVDPELNVKVALTLTKCPRCVKDITSEAQFCPSCGMVLGAKAAVTLEEERLKANHLMDLLMKDNEVKDLLSRKIHELYASSQPHHQSQAIP
jgi:integrase/recombinase XerD